MSKLQEIYDGWKNLLIPDEEIKPHIEKIAATRMNVCNTCTYNSEHPLSKPNKLRPDVHCTECGCTLAAKTRSLTSSCPFKFWRAEVKNEENE